MDTVDLDQLFEEYVETDFLQHCSDPVVDRSSSEDLARLFDLSSTNESAVYPSTPILHQDEDMAWQQAVQKSGQNPALTVSNDSFSFRVDAKGKESLSDSELLNFEDLFDSERNQLRSYSQPSTPRPHTTKAIKKAVSFHQDHSLVRGIHKLSRKTSTPAFAKMMQPSFYRSPIPDVWSRKMEATADAYSMRVAPHGITSPPPSSKLTHHENSSGFFSQHAQPYAEDQSPLASPTTNHNGMNFANYQITPQASPAIGISNSNNNSNNDPFNDNMGLTFSSSVSSAALSALQTPPSSLRMPMTTWGPTDTSPAMDFGFSASPDYSTTKTAGWWDNTDAAAVGPTYRESNQRTTSQYSNGSMEGLGISCDSASFGDFGVAGLGISNGNGDTLRHQASHQNLNAARRKSSAAAPRQASTPNVGFVNFTPHDSRKILTGVAPSGSSKTKARREKEAAEKRRKLSQAAMKAVMEAGGDVDSLRRLEREGLLVLEN
ncbi:hypothetical protein SNOG_14631 [Parastagonospora nodorum SN15]|uniref:Developmental regulatory protein wetA n=1 Tax=Phaeosphaeria nodorum (strain SN15 / ATCC MYA-4574 / FGSC 10173) TaxID=321614 RepID=Q0U0B6_PHANO|nr:hypothetical protein SNOG_14631 [Parastagonospora nodorum SN15]EAT77823.2 hypothetical protein SNOG_14631 [Parastagonospora nodorum SN15]